MRNVILLTSASNEMRGRAMSTVALTVRGSGCPERFWLPAPSAESVGPRFARVALQASLAALASLLVIPA